MQASAASCFPTKTPRSPSPPPQARAKALPLRVTCLSPGPIDSPFQLGRTFSSSADKLAEEASPGPKLAVGDIVRTAVWCLGAPEAVEVGDVVVRALAPASAQQEQGQHVPPAQ